MIRWTFILLSAIVGVISIVNAKNFSSETCLCSTQSITPLINSEHLLVSAFMDNRVKGWDVRIVAIVRTETMVPLHCVFCCGGDLSDQSTLASLHGNMGFGFPFEAKFVLCRVPSTCKNPTHIALSIQPDSRKEAGQQGFLPILNQKTGGTEQAIMPQFDFTVCLSTLYGEINNVLQFTQALEMYRILGVDRVMVYNTSCGPDLDRLLHSYSEEGFVEMVPWPIDTHLTPSRGWKYEEHGVGDLHYYGQMATLHDCMYRNMDLSSYVLLHDFDEIIVPYHHDNLTALMSQLKKQEPKAGVFKFRMDLFPTDHVETFNPPQWQGVPGINILEHNYRHNQIHEGKYGEYKMIVQPRMIEEISVHSPRKYLRNTFVVPADMARIVHVRGCSMRYTKPPSDDPNCKGQLHKDNRLWHFHEELIASVDKALRRIGMLKTSRAAMSHP